MCRGWGRSPSDCSRTGHCPGLSKSFAGLDEDWFILLGDCRSTASAGPVPSMSIECRDQFKSWACASLLVVIALAPIPIQPVAAQSSNVQNASIWGAMFKSQVEKCWKKPAPVGDEAANMKVVLEIRLTREGRLVEQPLVSSESSPTASDYSKAYQKSALRAIAECQPYTLPVEYYDQWKYFMPVFLEISVSPKGKGKQPAGLFDARTRSICRGC